MIKAIFFDFDGVLTNFECGSSTVCRNLSGKTGFSFDKLLSCYDRHTRDLYTTTISHKTIWNDFCKCMGRDININIALLDYAFRNVPLNAGMFELAKNLRKNYKTGIITDNTKERFSAITDEFKLREKFDAIILSADVGATKKDARIFKAALGALEVMAEECVFIDNSKKNLEIPARMGFNTVFYNFEKKDFDSLAKDLQKLGVD